jgi:hypothetical protein
VDIAKQRPREFYTCGHADQSIAQVLADDVGIFDKSDDYKDLVGKVRTRIIDASANEPRRFLPGNIVSADWGCNRRWG